MFTFLVEQSLHNRVLVPVIMVILMGCGAFTGALLPVDVFLTLSRLTVTIMTEDDGPASPEV